MPKRAAKIVSAILVNILAGIPLTTMARGETANAEGCLSSPKGETPAGSHWFYRIDHVSKRNCWYLRREGGGVSQALPQSSPPAPAPAARPSIADAHAELRPQPVREDNPAVSPPAIAAGNEASPNASAWNAAAAVTTRWPESVAATGSVPNAAPATAAPASDTPPPSTNPVSEAAPPSASFAYLSVPIRPETIPTLFAATVGALAFAGAAALISRHRRTRLRRRQARHGRGPIWETTDDDRIVLSDYPSMDHRDYRPRFARDGGGATAASPEFIRRPPRRATR